VKGNMEGARQGDWMGNRVTRRFGVFYLLLFLPIGMQAPYLFLFFQRQGFTDSQLGTLAAVMPIMNVVSPPVWGAMADRLGDRRRMVVALLVASGLVFPWLLVVKSFAATLGLVIVFSAFALAPVAITDAMALEHVEREKGDYGRLRLWGSVGFALPLLAFGLLLRKGAGESAASLYPMFIGYAAFRLISAAWVGALPASRGTSDGRFDWRAARAFTRPRFVALAACAMVAVGAMSAYYLYFTIYLDQVGIADNLKGYFWAVGVAAETGMMLVIGRLIRRIGLKWTFVLSLAGCALRLLAFSFPLSPAEIAAAQCLHALTFTAFTVSSIMFVNQLTPPHLRASGQSVWAALTHGVGAATGSKMAGMATGTHGLLGMYRLFAIVASVAMVAAAALVREPKDKEQS